MALFISQLRRAPLSGFCRAKLSYLPLVRPPALQKVQKKIYSTLDFGEKSHPTCETSQKDELESSRYPSRAANTRRLHVTNLLTDKNNYTTEETLLKYFSQYGEVENLEFFRRKFTHLPRGFAFVTFRHVESAQKVLGDAGCHVIDGQNVKVEIPLKTEKRALDPEGKKGLTVVVNNILNNTSKQVIEEHFSQFGNVDRVILVQKDSTGGNLSSYYVIVSSLCGAKKALEQPVQRISDQGIDSQVMEFTKIKNFTGKTQRVVSSPIADHVTVEDLRDYFQKFGDVDRVELRIHHYDVPYPESNLNIAFVHFLDEAIVEEIVKYEYHIIGGSKVKVLKHRNLQTPTERAQRQRLSMEGLPMSTKRMEIKQFFEETFGVVPKDILMKKPRVFDKKLVCVVSFSDKLEAEMVLARPAVTFHGDLVHFRKLCWSKTK